jgi:eukaryotic-like serine/threonine-protein kinase
MGMLPDMILAVAGRTEEGWLNSESIRNFPCEDLRTIDQLWVQYSNGRFGFSVQKRIYQSLGGTDIYDSKIWEAFGDRVGWGREGSWLYYSNITFSTQAPSSHLPLCEVVIRDDLGFLRLCSSLASRLVKFNI